MSYRQYKYSLFVQNMSIIKRTDQVASKPSLQDLFFFFNKKETKKITSEQHLFLAPSLLRLLRSTEVDPERRDTSRRKNKFSKILFFRTRTVLQKRKVDNENEIRTKTTSVYIVYIRKLFALSFLLKDLRKCRDASLQPT